MTVISQNLEIKTRNIYYPQHVSVILPVPMELLQIFSLCETVSSVEIIEVGFASPNKSFSIHIARVQTLVIMLRGLTYLPSSHVWRYPNNEAKIVSKQIGEASWEEWCVLGRDVGGGKWSYGKTDKFPYNNLFQVLLNVKKKVLLNSKIRNKNQKQGIKFQHLRLETSIHNKPV